MRRLSAITLSSSTTTFTSRIGSTTLSSTAGGARALLRLAELEADRPPEDAPDYEHGAYAHKRAATMASVASDLLSAVARSDVVTDVETGRLLAGKTTTHELVADHQQVAHWVHEEARRNR